MRLLHSHRRGQVLGLVLFVLAACDAEPPAITSTGETSQRWNLLLISIDTLRADHLELYGHGRPTSPRLQELAKDAVVFENFFHSGGGTLPSHMTMMTSLNPEVHRIGPHNDRVLPEARVTLAEQLRDAGYATGAFVDAGFVRAKYGFYQGFDVYDDQGGRFAKILPKALNWVDAHRAGPFFLFVHTYDVHSQEKQLPYECPGDYPHLYTRDLDLAFDGCRDGRCGTSLLKSINKEIRAGAAPSSQLTEEEVRYLSALYDGCINYADQKIGEILEQLHSLGIYDRTLVVVTSDHGEEFLDHGLLLHEQGGYEEMIHIPLIMKLPRSSFGGQRVSHLAAMIDVMPTVLDILGVQVNPEAQGRSLLPAIVNGQPVRDEVAIIHTLRTARWKFNEHRRFFFDLANDPNEKENLYAEDDPRLADFRQRLAKLNKQNAQLARELSQGSTEARRVDLTEKERNELRALGYLD